MNTRHLKSLLFRRQCLNSGFSNNRSLHRGKGHSTIDANDYFQVNKKVNWDPEGPLKPLYSLNYLRVPYLRDRLSKAAPGEKYSTCLEGMKILDVGCGGGYLSEALAKFGAKVTGIDTNEDAIVYAKKGGPKDNMPAYTLTTIEEHCKEHAESYDVVVSSEVIDHVAQKELFVESCARVVRPGGKLFFTTINRTRLAQFVLIYLDENVFKVIPKGAHDFNMFIKPSELQYMLEMNDCYVQSIKGYYYYPFSNSWKWINNLQFLYAMEATKST